MHPEGGASERASSNDDDDDDRVHCWPRQPVRSREAGSAPIAWLHGRISRWPSHLLKWAMRWRRRRASLHRNPVHSLPLLLRHSSHRSSSHPHPSSPLLSAPLPAPHRFSLLLAPRTSLLLPIIHRSSHPPYSSHSPSRPPSPHVCSSSFSSSSPLVLIIVSPCSSLLFLLPATSALFC